MIPLAIVGAISGFQPQNSTSIERGFTMSWLVLGIFEGASVSWNPKSFLGAPILDESFYRSYSLSRWDILMSIKMVGLAVPALGGMVVVGQMIRKFGICKLTT